MDCDDVMFALASDTERATLTGALDAELRQHLAACETCRLLHSESDEDWRWIVRLPADALDEGGALVLPMIDPIVYDLEAPLATGGMGRITKATDRRLGRTVAIKEVLHPQWRARFEREAMITARLQHPAIVPIYEAGTWPDGAVYYSMRLVSGGTLATAIAEARTLAQRLALLPHAVAVTEALAYAHSQRIIHRDLKPGNVLVGEFGETVVIDWGLAKELGRAIDGDGATHRAAGGAHDSDLTRAGSVFGTPCFMAVEQAAGDRLDERADVYALGAILYNLLAGVPPYLDRHAGEAADRIIALGLQEPPTPIGELVPDAPADLRAIVEKAMARRKEDRYPTAREMAAELRRFQAGQLIGRAYTLRELFARWVRRHRTAVSVGAIAAVALAVVGTLALVNIDRSRDAERAARHEAEATVGALLEEQGRGRLLAGDHDRALVLLEAAYRGGRRSIALQQLLAGVTRDLELASSELVLGERAFTAGFTEGGRIVTVEEGGRVTVWSGADAGRTFSLGVKRVYNAALDPTARSVALVDEHALTMWDVAGGTRRWRVEDPAYRDPRLVFDETGTRVALVPNAFDDAPDPRAKILDVATGALVATLAIDAAPIAEVAFAGDRVAACTRSRVRAWKLPGLEELGTFDPEVPGDGKSGIELGFGDAGTLVVISHDRAWRWSIAAGPRLLSTHGARITTFATSRAGALVALADAAGLVRLVDLDGETLGTWQSNEQLERLELSAGGTLLVGSNGWDRVLMWDTVSLGLLRQIEAHRGGLDVATIDRAGARILTTGVHDQRARISSVPRGNRLARVAGSATTLTASHWLIAAGAAVEVRALAGTLLRTVAAPGTAARPAAGRELAASRDGTRVISGGRDGAIGFDPGAGAAIELPMGRMSADGRLLFTIDDAGERRRGRVLDARTAAVVLSVDLGERGEYGSDISPDGTWIAAGFDDEIAVWRVPSGERRSIKTQTQGVNCAVRFDPTGALVAFDKDYLARFDLAGGAQLGTYPTALQLDDVASSEDGKRLAARSGAERRVELWSTDDARLLLATDATASALSVDGARFATGTSDGRIQIWESATGRELARYPAHRRGITQLAFSPDGTRLAAQGADGHASLWDVALEDRSPAELAALVARLSPFQVDKTGLVTRKN